MQSKQLVCAKTQQLHAHRPITTYHVHAKSCMEEMHKLKGQQKPTKWFFFSSHVEIYIFLHWLFSVISFLLGWMCCHTVLVHSWLRWGMVPVVSQRAREHARKGKHIHFDERAVSHSLKKQAKTLEDVYNNTSPVLAPKKKKLESSNVRVSQASREARPALLQRCSTVEKIGK